MLSKKISISDYIKMINKLNASLFHRLDDLVLIHPSIIIDIWKDQRLGKKKTFVVIFRNTDLSELFHRTIFIDTEIKSEKHVFKLMVAEKSFDRLIDSFPGINEQDGYGYGQSISDEYQKLKDAVVKARKEEYEARGMDDDEQVEFMIKSISTIYKLNLLSTNGKARRFKGVIEASTK